MWNTAWDLWAYRCFQLRSGKDEEALQLLQCLNAHLLHQWRLGTDDLPHQLHSLLQVSPYKLLGRPVEDKLAWIDKIHLGREYTLGHTAPPRLRNYYRSRFIEGGLLARLRRSKLPPPLRTTARAPIKALLTIDQEED